MIAQDLRVGDAFIDPAIGEPVVVSTKSTGAKTTVMRVNLTTRPDHRTVALPNDTEVVCTRHA